MHRTGSFYALLMCGLLDATTEWIGGRQKEREKTIRNGIRSSRLSTCCHFRLLAVCVYRYTAIGFFFFSSSSHIESVNENYQLEHESVIGLGKKKYGVYINADSSTANGFILLLSLFLTLKRAEHRIDVTKGTFNAIHCDLTVATFD